MQTESRPYTPETRPDRLELARWFDAKAREYKARKKAAGPAHVAGFDESIKHCRDEANRLRALD